MYIDRKNWNMATRNIRGEFIYLIRLFESISSLPIKFQNSFHKVLRCLCFCSSHKKQQRFINFKKLRGMHILIGFNSCCFTTTWGSPVLSYLLLKFFTLQHTTLRFPQHFQIDRISPLTIKHRLFHYERRIYNRL